MDQNEPIWQPSKTASETSRRLWTGVLLVFAVLVLARLLVSLFPPGNAGGLDHPGVGRPLPMLQLRRIGQTEQRIDLDDLRGQVVLVNFWGTWCPPCRVELPHIAEIDELYGGRQDFRLAAISCPPPGQEVSFESLEAETLYFLETQGISLPVYADSGDTTRQAAEMALGGFRGFPTTLLLDRAGVIRGVWIGYRSGYEIQMRERIDQLLAAR